MRLLSLLLSLPLLAASGATSVATVQQPTPAPTVSVPASPAVTPSLHIQAPTNVPLGAPIALTFTVRDAVDLAGYELELLYDGSALRVSGLRQRDSTLRSLGRDVAPLGPVEHERGVSFGLFTCPVSDCVSRTDWVQPDLGGSGEIYLGTLTMTTLQPGTVQLAVDHATFVRADGATVAVAVPDAPLAVQVGPADSPALFSVPAAEASTVPAGTGAAVPLDLSRDGRVDFADAMEVAMAWTRARSVGARCGPAVELEKDVNGDGCVTVADAQRIAAGFTHVVTTTRGTEAHASSLPGESGQP